MDFIRDLERDLENLRKLEEDWENQSRKRLIEHREKFESKIASLQQNINNIIWMRVYAEHVYATINV